MHSLYSISLSLEEIVRDRLGIVCEDKKVSGPVLFTANSCVLELYP